MDHIGTLNTIAQIAISLIGFSGIVVIFGDRFKRGWSAEESLQFYSLIAPPMVALFCSFIPKMLSTITQDWDLIWQISNAILGFLHLANFSYFVFKIKNAILFQKLAGLTGIIIITAHFLTSLKIIPLLEFIFITGLIQQIFVGVLNFTLLFKPINNNKI